MTTTNKPNSAVQVLREALTFYAEQQHFVLHEPDAFDTVSGEPQNWQEDESNTIMFEDGSVAKQALAATEEAERAAIQPAGEGLTKAEIKDVIEAINAAISPTPRMFFPQGWNVILDKLHAMVAAPPVSAPVPEAHCRVTCQAAKVDGIGCPHDSCDIEDGVRAAPVPEAKAEQVARSYCFTCDMDVSQRCDDEMCGIPADPAVKHEASELPSLPDPLDIDWPELNCQALGCGVEDRNIHDRYEAAQYGWQDGVDRAIDRVPEAIFDADQMRAYGQACIDARSPVAAAPDTSAALAEMEQRKDAAYYERNQVVAALAKCFPSGKARTAIDGWSEDWHGCVYIDLPTGQVSWHYHDSQSHLFDSIPHYLSAWDGHDTVEKYRRLAALRALSAAAPSADAKGEGHAD